MNDLTPTETTSEIDIFNEENPRSIVNILPKRFSEKVRDAQLERPELFEMDEDELLSVLGEEKKIPTATDSRLRLSFWSEFERAQALNRDVRVFPIHAGICIKNYFHNIFLKKPDKVAFMLCPPADYTISLHEALLFGLAELRRVLSLPHLKNGKLDSRLLETKLKIYEKIEQRALGAIPQKVLNLHGKAPAQDLPEGKSLDEKLKELEERDRMGTGGSTDGR